MSFQETVKEMRELLSGIAVDLEKGASGNKAASQRVRTGTIKLEKAAKKYRKESIRVEKTSVGKKKSAKKAAPAKKTVKVKAKAKSKTIHCSMNKCGTTMKHKTAKIPMKNR